MRIHHIPGSASLMSIAVLFLFASAGASADIRLDGPISSNIEIDETSSVYVISKDLVVEEGATLTIKGGVRIVVVRSSARILVKGRLMIDGTGRSPVVIRGDGNDWGQIVFDHAEGVSVLRHLIIENAEAEGGAIVAKNSSVEVLYSTVRDNPGGGVSGIRTNESRSRLEVYRTVFERNGGQDVRMSNLFDSRIERNTFRSRAGSQDSIDLEYCRDVTLVDNTILDSPDEAIDIDYSSDITVQGNLIRGAGNHGMTIGEGSSDIRLIRNAFSRMEKGVHVWGGAEASFLNNTFYRVGSSVSTQGNAEAYQVNTLFFESGSGRGSAMRYAMSDWEEPRGEGSFQGNPKFLDPENDNFSLRRGSPALDAGDPESPLDPDGTRADIGSGFIALKLPIELAGFEVTVQEASAQLTWTTANETDNLGFEVQHALKGASFDPVGFVPGAGNSTNRRDYSFSLTDLTPGTHRFRLRQVGVDGVDSYSGQVEVKVEMTTAYALSPAHPNPFSNSTRISFTSAEAEPLEIDLFDLSGRLVRALYRGTPEAGESRFLTVWADDLSAGLYLVQIRGRDTPPKAIGLTVVN